MSLRHNYPVLLMTFLLQLIALPWAWAGDSCDPNVNGTPATTVPQFRAEAPGQSLWPLDPVTGGTLFKPASAIAAPRDSTSWDTTLDPSAEYGTELFHDLVVLEGNDDWLFVAYNVGLQAWDLRTTPRNPRLAAWREGRLGHFEIYPFDGEGHVYVETIDAVTAADGNIYVAIGGRSGHGLSIWRFDDPTAQHPTFTQIYQEASRWVRDVELINHSSGRTYALATDEGASFGGVTFTT